MNSSKDIYSLKSFADEAKYDEGLFFGWAILNRYPQLKKYFDKKYNINDIKSLKNFIKLKHSKEKEIIKKNLEIYKKNWQKVEKDFFNLVDEIFPDKYWPKGKYIAYPTIWRMYPRFLDDKTFQIPHKHRKARYVNVVIAHEMLHFVFFEYFFKNYRQYRGKKYESLVWDTSEIFNAIIQGSPKWIRVFKLNSTAYPKHEKIVKKINKIYHKKDKIDADKLIEDILKEAKKIKIS